MNEVNVIYEVDGKPYKMSVDDYRFIKEASDSSGVPEEVLIKDLLLESEEQNNHA